MSLENTGDNFVAHGYLYLWQPNLVWLHALSDLIIALAFFAIPITLITILKARKPNLPYGWVLTLCAVCIFLCAITHLIAMISIWYPVYYVHGIAKALTAALSIGTALILLPVIPLILKDYDNKNHNDHHDHSG